MKNIFFCFSRKTVALRTCLSFGGGGGLHLFSEENIAALKKFVAGLILAKKTIPAGWLSDYRHCYQRGRFRVQFPGLPNRTYLVIYPVHFGRPVN